MKLKTDKTCARDGCEEEFRPWNSLQKYCSRTCSNKVPGLHTGGGPARSGRDVACEVCAKEFYVNPAQLGKRRFCSQECMGLGVRKKRLCSVCGATYYTNGRRGHPRVTCSDTCEREAKSLAKLGPGNPNWSGQKVREENWRSAFTGVCALCGSTDRLHLHHVVYAQKLRDCGGDRYDPRNGMTLCWDCHIAHHNASKRISVDALTETHWEFAREVLGDAAPYYFERRYDGDGD